MDLNLDYLTASCSDQNLPSVRVVVQAHGPDARGSTPQVRSSYQVELVDHAELHTVKTKTKKMQSSSKSEILSTSVRRDVSSERTPCSFCSIIGGVVSNRCSSIVVGARGGPLAHISHYSNSWMVRGHTVSPRVPPSTCLGDLAHMGFGTTVCTTARKVSPDFALPALLRFLPEEDVEKYHP